MFGFRPLGYLTALVLGATPIVSHDGVSVEAPPDAATEKIRTVVSTEPQPAVTFQRIASATTGCAVATTSGWQFKLKSDVTVRALGVHDRGNDGLINPHKVGIWDAFGTLLVSGTVPGGKKARRIGTFRYVDVAQVTLKGGGTYVIGAFYPTPLRDAHVGGGTGNRLFSDGHIEWLESRRTIAPALKLPTNATKLKGEPLPGTFGPNFLFTRAATPEEANVTLRKHYAMHRVGAAWKLTRKDVREKRPRVDGAGKLPERP